jgi:hypothetical protein
MVEPEPEQASARDNHGRRDSFCVYLARQFIAKKGFSVGYAPEAAQLAEHCDIMLWRFDGLTFTIACMIDRETHPGKTFDLSPYVVENIGHACLKYSARVNRKTIPVRIEIYEVGPADDPRRQRLSAYASGPSRDMLDKLKLCPP